ncbi:MAG: hypothetical protein R3B09_05895 [Nannocystaceae bacterium]
MKDPGEECDNGGSGVDSKACDADCTVPECAAASCGDGFIEAGVEECDDGNGVDLDGCSSICEIEEPKGCAEGGFTETWCLMKGPSPHAACRRCPACATPGARGSAPPKIPPIPVNPPPLGGTTETSPACKARARKIMKTLTPLPLPLLTFLFAAACAGGPTEETATDTASTTHGGETSTSTDGATAGTSSSGSDSSGASSSSSSTEGSGGSPDLGGGLGECDPWSQDCPDGFKCMAYTDEGSQHFTGDKCSPVVDSPKALGDPCHVEGGWWTGLDDCDYGLACWNINQETNEGQCVALCTGNADTPGCPEAGDICVFWVSGISHVCLATCDPLSQDCDVGQSCLPNWVSGAQEWVCTAEYSGDEGQEFDPCLYTNVCDPGLFCGDPSLAIECTDPQSGCCLALCDLTNWECDGEGAECLPFYGPGEAPPAYENVGLCGLPG